MQHSWLQHDCMVQWVTTGCHPFPSLMFVPFVFQTLRGTIISSTYQVWNATSGSLQPEIIWSSSKPASYRDHLSSIGNLSNQTWPTHLPTFGWSESKVSAREVTTRCRWHLHTIHDGGVPVEFLQALAGFGVLVKGPQVVFGVNIGHQNKPCVWTKWIPSGKLT